MNLHQAKLDVAALDAKIKKYPHKSAEWGYAWAQRDEIRIQLLKYGITLDDIRIMDTKEGTVVAPHPELF